VAPPPYPFIRVAADAGRSPALHCIIHCIKLGTMLTDFTHGELFAEGWVVSKFARRLGARATTSTRVTPSHVAGTPLVRLTAWLRPARVTAQGEGLEFSSERRTIAKRVDRRAGMED
jgi:hypothetical protein